MRRAAAGVIAATVLVACAGAESRDTGSTSVVRDSAGITIVENRGSAWRDGEGWTLGPTPAVDIGVVDGDPRYQLHRPTSAVRLSDGTIVIANTGTQELRFYDAAGRHVRTAGGRGGGPGEFEGLRRIDRVAGDTLLAWDWSHARLSRFAPDGRFLSALTLATVAPFSFSDLRGHLDDGGFVLAPGPAFVRLGNNEVKRDTLTLVRFNHAGEPGDTIAAVPGAERFSSSELRVQMPLPYGRAAHAVLANGRLLVADNGRAELAFHGLDGALTQVVRYERSAPAISPEALAAYKRRRIETASQDFRSAMEKLMEIVPFPQHAPLFESVRVDVAGNVWLSEVRVSGDEETSHWTVFDTDGRQLGTVTMPPRFEPFQIGDDYVLGQWKDDLDVEHVRLYQLRKAGSKSRGSDDVGNRAYATSAR